MTLYEFLKDKNWWVIKPDNNSWIPVSEDEIAGYVVEVQSLKD